MGVNIQTGPTKMKKTGTLITAESGCWNNSGYVKECWERISSSSWQSHIQHLTWQTPDPTWRLICAALCERIASAAEPARPLLSARLSKRKSTPRKVLVCRKNREREEKAAHVFSIQSHFFSFILAHLGLFRIYKAIKSRERSPSNITVIWVRERKKTCINMSEKPLNHLRPTFISLVIRR